jgi:hypothetical protein
VRLFERVTRLITCSACLVLLLGIAANAAARYATFDDVRQVLVALADVIPPELKQTDAAAGTRWSEWAARHDREIRARLAAGDQETIINWLLFGTTFTSRPRVPLADTQPVGRISDADLANLIGDRAADLATALASPGQDERRLFARDLFVHQGYQLGKPADRLRLIQHLLTLVTQVLADRAKYARETEAIRNLPDTSEQFAARSKLFRDRGLSADTSFRPNFALERALAEMARTGALKAGSVREIAIIGPGLDFADKSSGYDFYPQQTLQPFALIDSLLRLGIGTTAPPIHVTTLDLSPRVNAHLRSVHQRATAGQPYRIRLPLDPDVPWSTDVLAYWKTAGDRIGTGTAAVPALVNGTKVNVRTIAVRPGVASRVHADDVNIVVQRMDPARFDLVVATNVFIYYDVLDQALAMANVRAMLRTGGFLVTNNALLELPDSHMRSAGYVTVQYSSLPEDGDHVVWYRAD